MKLFREIFLNLPYFWNKKNPKLFLNSVLSRKNIQYILLQLFCSCSRSVVLQSVPKLFPYQNYQIIEVFFSSGWDLTKVKVKTFYNSIFIALKATQIFYINVRIDFSFHKKEYYYLVLFAVLSIIDEQKVFLNPYVLLKGNHM